MARISSPRSTTSNATRTRQGLVLALACAAMAMVGIDTAIVNVAVPSIQRDLGVTPSASQWVVVAYGLVLGGFLLFGGRLTDHLGRRRIFVSGMAVFTAASFVAGAAQGPGMLIAARAVQGSVPHLSHRQPSRSWPSLSRRVGTVTARSASSVRWAGWPARWGSSRAAC